MQSGIVYLTQYAVGAGHQRPGRGGISRHYQPLVGKTQQVLRLGQQPAGAVIGAEARQLRALLCELRLHFKQRLGETLITFLRGRFCLADVFPEFAQSGLQLVFKFVGDRIHAGAFTANTGFEFRDAATQVLLGGL